MYFRFMFYISLKEGATMLPRRDLVSFGAPRSTPEHQLNLANDMKVFSFQEVQGPSNK